LKGYFAAFVARAPHDLRRLKNYLRDADDGLLVTNFDVTPHEEIEELAVFPQFREVQIKPPAWRLDAHNRDGARCSSQCSAILFGDRRGTAGRKVQ